MYLRPSTNNKPPSTTQCCWIKRPPKLTLAASHRVSHGMRCDDLFGSRHFVRRLMARACGARACGAVGARGATPCLARWPRQSLRSAAPRTSRRSARAPRAARAGSRGAPGRRGTSVRRRPRTINSFAVVPARARARSGSAEKKRLVVARDARAKSVRQRVGDYLSRARILCRRTGAS